jgi:uncharacterized protein YqjF (DUF2071 family)
MPEEVNGWPTSHRPYSAPDSEWVMYQEWHELLFAHWALDKDLLRPLVPPYLPLDTHGGKAWVGVTPFRVAAARARLSPAVPGLSDFLEINVRTYVTMEGKPGVYFFSLDASSPLAVAGARALFHLPYYPAEMKADCDGPWIRYASRRASGDGAFRAVYRPVGEVFEAERGSLEYFLAERYCLYTVDDGGSVYRCDIHHRPWPLQTAEAEIEVNTIAAADGVPLPDAQPLLHYAHKQPAVVWPPERMSGFCDAPQSGVKLNSSQ